MIMISVRLVTSLKKPKSMSLYAHSVRMGGGVRVDMAFAYSVFNADSDAMPELLVVTVDVERKGITIADASLIGIRADVDVRRGWER